MNLFLNKYLYQASDALGRTLVVMLWQRCGGFEHNLALGGAEICLDKLSLPQRTYGWYPLFPATSLAADESPDWSREPSPERRHLAD